jgi:hypothetical protein
MHLAKYLFLNFQRLKVDIFGFSSFSPRTMNICKISKGVGNFGMYFAKFFFAQGVTLLSPK